VAGDAWGVNPELKVVAAKQGGVFSRQQASRSGYTPEQMRERLADGRWEKVRYGQYAEAADLSGRPPWEQQIIRHRRSVHAAMNSVQPGSVVVSHQSALVLHELTMWGVDLDEVHLNRLDKRKGRLVAGVRYHRGNLTPADLTKVSGLAATTLPRALVELACTASFESTVVSADAAFHEHKVSTAEIVRLLTVIESWPGSASARSALAFVNPQCESVGESRLRVLMHNHGLPAPVLQSSFKDADGFVGRVDFYFPEYQTIVEFDGLMKYTNGSAEVLVQEKRREDRLRALGLEVVRITWSDLNRPATVVAQIRQAFVRARR